MFNQLERTVMLFAVSGSGIIRLREYANGDMSLVGIGGATLIDLLNDVCTQQHGHRRVRDWLIRSSHVAPLIADLEKIALRVHSSTPKNTTASSKTSLCSCDVLAKLGIKVDH
jgi:hypothetical protein